VAGGGSMLGRAAAVRDVPWFWSDQFRPETSRIAGDVGDPDEVAVRGEREAFSFIAFHLRAGTVSGGLRDQPGQGTCGPR